MGGGDLNTKKSWHPNTMKNQERVWKAEQAEANEKRRIDDLKREIDNERNKEELIHHGQSSGVLSQNTSKKMDWMYKQPNESVDHEQYLLGKKIDKAFEKIVSEEKSSQAQPSSKNHVEHECIPFSIRNLSTDTNSREYQVDMARKMMEDPLVAIRQRELESRTQLLQNPVKLKELTMLLKSEQAKKKKKKDKKSKKSKSPDIDRKLKEKLDKLHRYQDKDIDLKNLLSTHISKKKGNKKRRKSISSASSSDSESEKHSTKKDRLKESSYSSKECNRSNKDSNKEYSHSNKEYSHSNKEYSHSNKEYSHSSKEYSHSNKEYSHSNKEYSHSNKEYSHSYKEYSHPSKEYSHRSKEYKKLDERLKRTSSDNKEEFKNERDNRTNDTYKSSSKHYSDSSDDDRPPKKKNYGLVRADGTQMELKKSYTAPKKQSLPVKSLKPQDNKYHQKKLTEEEKETKRREMMSNASERDKQREKNVSYYKEQDKRLDEKEKKIGYSEGFIEKQMRETTKHLSVESRIKSNVYNIQRSSRHMDANFAKR